MSAQRSHSPSSSGSLSGIAQVAGWVHDSRCDHNQPPSWFISRWFILLVRWLAWLGFTLGLLLGTAMIVWNTLDIVQLDAFHPFVQEKILHFKHNESNASLINFGQFSWVHSRLVWLYVLYVHLFAGSVCLVCCITQNSKWVRRKWPRLHRYSGRVYAVIVLLVLCPTGFYLTAFATGGLTMLLAFLFMGILLFVATWLGWSAALKRQWQWHQAWMWRSLAMALVAVTFRLIHGVLLQTEMDLLLNYILSTWGAIALNGLVAEYFICSRLSGCRHLLIWHKRHTTDTTNRLENAQQDKQLLTV